MSNDAFIYYANKSRNPSQVKSVKIQPTINGNTQIFITFIGGTTQTLLEINGEVQGSNP